MYIFMYIFMIIIMIIIIIIIIIIWGRGATNPLNAHSAVRSSDYPK